ncbi:MAG TPA: isocitrate lyase/phosphoenolpyruvate mutase family protein [Baekduia sp.]|nr:isocitrate lyase/phosphoenolpyruvate mutase family protein [Baekduia sp.]
MTDQHEPALTFRALHDRDAPPLRLLNAWDAGSAKVLVAAGAPALGTTSAGVAFALGLPDGERLTRDAMLAAVAVITDAVPVPVSADLEAGYADEPAGVAETVRLALDAGAVGFNLEDGRSDGSLTSVQEHAARVRAAVDAVRASGIPAFVNARTDTVWLGAGDETETIARLHAYAEAGADGLFVPGATDAELLSRLVAATPLPLNVLADPALPPVDELARLGVARVSSGSGPARLAFSAAYAAAQELLGNPGTYGDDGGLSYTDVNRIMSGS